MPYAALRLSPSTRMTGGSSAPTGGATNQPNHNTTISRRRMVHTTPLVRAEALAKAVASPGGRLTILDDISLAVAPGEAVAIVGTSGSGKSTLLGLLAGLDAPTHGRVWLGGIALDELDEDGRAELRARLVGFVFQSFHLLPTLTALENVMLPLELRGEEARATARELLARVGLEARASHYPAQLSGGEQQRVALARAFVVRPKVLFADEPTGNLDERTGARVIELMFALREEAGCTLILVTHDAALAARCDRRVSLEAGRIAGQS
ncbi:ATP-binding cassette domain-containing protein [Ectothiorhodospiraceae bacterium 2226]|nr:ATP-binding cassette domain-containing protein [Ectothiorhodospiraceae bacterium 2226]